MPLETMVETMPSMDSVVLVESVPSAASMMPVAVSMMSVAVSMMPMRAMAPVESMPSAMTVSPVSTSGPGVIDNTRPAEQGEHREQIAHKLVHASIDPWTVMSTGPHL